MSFRSRLHVFRRLQWKLTLTYALVTTGAILVVEFVLFLIIWWVLIHSPAIPKLLLSIFQGATQEIARDLTSDPPNAEHIEAWLHALVTRGEVQGVTFRRRMRVNIDPASISFAAVTDIHGRVVSAYPSRECPQGAALDQCVQLVALAPLHAAMQGVRDSDRLIARTRDFIYIATPIFEPSKRPVGVLFVRITVPMEWNELSRAILRALLSSGLIVLLLTIPVGTVFGFLTARGLARRLRTLAEAADAWSRGDFSVVVHDKSPDELGQLARRLNRMAEDVQNLLQARQELAALEERNRLARELHDSVKQQVFATAMQVAAARHLIDRDPEQAKAHLVEAERLAREAQKELSALIRELRPAALEGKGLVPALEDYVADWSHRTGIPVRLRARGRRSMPLRVEQAVFRVIQEALTNVAKHSRATQVTVDLVWGPEWFYAEVADNGQGFDMQEKREEGLGLHSMQERMAELGGTCRVESAPGRGTRVRLSVPVYGGEK